MSEKIYKAMKNTGALNIAVGIVTLVTGIASGILLIVSGANLLKKKNLHDFPKMSSYNVRIYRKDIHGRLFYVHLSHQTVQSAHLSPRQYMEDWKMATAILALEVSLTFTEFFWYVLLIL